MTGQLKKKKKDIHELFIRGNLRVLGLYVHTQLYSWTCCASKDGILHSSVVTSGYLTFQCLSTVSTQSVHSPLNPDINTAFSSTQLLLTGFCFSCKPWRWLSRSQTTASGTNNRATFKVTPIPLPSSFCWSLWTSVSRLHPVFMAACTELLPCVGCVSVYDSSIIFEVKQRLKISIPYKLGCSVRSPLKLSVYASDAGSKKVKNMLLHWLLLLKL